MKLKKPIPPHINSIGRQESDTFYLTDVYLEALGDAKTEKSFLAKLSKSTKVEKEYHETQTRAEPLGAELLRQIYRISEPLSLVITGHLFIENFLTHIIEMKFRYAYLITENRDFTFNLKLEILKSKNYLDDKLYFDIKYLNQLRNKFAHNLQYDIAEFDMSKFYYFDQAYNFVSYSSKKSRHALNVYILRNTLKILLISLTKKYPSIAHLKTLN